MLPFRAPASCFYLLLTLYFLALPLLWFFPPLFFHFSILSEIWFQHFLRFYIYKNVFPHIFWVWKECHDTCGSLCWRKLKCWDLAGVQEMLLIIQKPSISMGILIITMGFWVVFPAPQNNKWKSLHAYFVKHETKFNLLKQGLWPCPTTTICKGILCIHLHVQIKSDIKKYLSTFWLWSDISKKWLLFSLFRYVYCQCVWTSIHTDRHTYILVLNIHIYIYTQRDMCTNLSQRHQDLHPPARVFAERAHPGVRKRPGFPTKNRAPSPFQPAKKNTWNSWKWKPLDKSVDILGNHWITCWKSKGKRLETKTWQQKHHRPRHFRS